MNKFLTALMLGLASASAQIIPIPYGHGSGDPISNWLAWQYVNENFTYVDTRVTSLSTNLGDADTNSIARSPIFAAYQASSLAWMSHGTWTVTNIFPSFYGISFQNPSGFGNLVTVMSSDNGSTWFMARSTNGPVLIGIWDQPQVQGLDIPHDPSITNVTIWAFTRPDLYGRQNDLYGQQLNVFLGGPNAAVPRSYVDAVMATNLWWNAPSDIQVNGHTLNLDSIWSLSTASAASRNTVGLRYAAMPCWGIDMPHPDDLVIDSIWIETTNVVVAVRTNFVAGGVTNLVPSAPTIQYTPRLDGATWSWIAPWSNSWPTVVAYFRTNFTYIGWDDWYYNGGPMPTVVTNIGTNYGFLAKFPIWDPSKGFVHAVCLPSAPAVSTVPILQMSPGTIAAATNTTWGYGAGLCRWDTNYLYVSVGTNAWKRSALAAW